MGLYTGGLVHERKLHISKKYISLTEEMVAQTPYTTQNQLPSALSNHFGHFPSLSTVSNFSNNEHSGLIFGSAYILKFTV